MAGLSYEQQEKFRSDGYLVVPSLFSESECETLRHRCSELVDEMKMDEHPRTLFSTQPGKQANDEYFLTSGDKIRYFFEEEAFDENGKLKVAKHLSLNKIGHGIALHALDPEFKRFTFQEKIKATCKSILMKKPVVAQSMYIFKQPGIGGEVTPHQDSTFLHTDPMNIIGFWIPLEDATEENSCLWFVPGSHTNGITNRFTRNPNGPSPATIITGTGPRCDDDKFVAVPVKKGSLVLIHGEVVHKSFANRSDLSRHVYTFHVIETLNTTYSKDNWLQPTEELPFPSLY